jgi:UDP-N-acetylmuramoyl-L-alanyl-D-glutamate--2,6-diaminopimelate ligase
MKLSDLLGGLDVDAVRFPSRSGGSDPADMEIGSIHCRAQEVEPGGLFVAIAGFRADGHDYIAEAVERGTVAVVVEKPAAAEAVVVEVASSRRALAEISTRFYGQPSQKLFVIGITGTNGKTTTAYLIESVLRCAGLEAGVIGTIDYRYGGVSHANPVTTPESIDLQRILADMLEYGVTHVVIEVSSHAIDLHRVDGCHLDIGVFTNLTRDHLDYHGDMATYGACKKRLFTDYLGPENPKRRKVAVINVDDPMGRELVDAFIGESITTGHGETCRVRPENYRLERDGTVFRLSTPLGGVDIASPLVGEHNLENILSAAGVGAAMGLSPETIRAGIEAVSTIPGRLEPIVNDRGIYVYVDYAHTPDALENVISALRAVSPSRLICIFGCGGDRDRGKRAPMGEIAGRRCDLAVVTSDNPRTEPPQAIIDQILAGMGRQGRPYAPEELRNGFTAPGYVVEPDRRSAIRLGVAAAGSGDTILIAGKGHETYQIVGSRIDPFDDRQEAKAALAAPRP